MSGYIDQEGNEVVPDPCGQRFHSCACSMLGPHAVHACVCGGKWSGTEGHETILELPGETGAFGILFGGGPL